MNPDRLFELTESIVAATMEELPPAIRERLAAIPVLIEHFPSSDDVESGVEPDTLGFFDEDAQGVARITLWIDNIRDFAREEDVDFTDEVRTTLLHEIGHALGWDEEDLDERGLG